MLNNRSKAMLDEESLKQIRQIIIRQNASAPGRDMLSASHDDDMNMQKLFRKTNRKEPNRTSHLISKPCSLFHRSDGVLAYLQSHLNKTKKQKKKIHSFFFLIYIYIYTIDIYIIHHSKDRIKTLKTPPVHLLHTIGSQKYFGHFCVSTNSSISL